MKKEELIEMLNEIMEDARSASTEAGEARDKANTISNDCYISDVIYYAEGAENSASECEDIIDDVVQNLENIIARLEEENSETETEETDEIYDVMISELKQTTEDKLTSFEYALLEKERSLAELREEFNRLTEEIHSDLENLENEIKGDE